jgi:hypothetical protein
MQQMKAKVTLTPCMNLEDLQKGLSQAREALRQAKAQS